MTCMTSLETILGLNSTSKVATMTMKMVKDQ
jgi:hypothetical protein